MNTENLENSGAIKAPELILIEEGTSSIKLTLNQLSETKTFADAFQIMPKQFPLEHHIFIKKIIQMVREAGIEAEIGQILAPVKHIERISKAEAEEKGIDPNRADNTRIKVVIGRIDIGSQFARKLWNLAIGFMYNEKGIEIYVGTNIAICSNMTIFGESKYYKNYGRNGVEISEMFQNIQDWIRDFEGIDQVNSELLERMAACSIDWTLEGNEFLGECLREAVRKNYHKGDSFPLTMGQVNKMASYMIDHEVDFMNNPTALEDEEVPGKRASLYHLYNAGTYILTHIADLPNKFGNIKDFTHWFEQTWLIPAESVKDDINEALTTESILRGKHFNEAALKQDEHIAEMQKKYANQQPDNIITAESTEGHVLRKIENASFEEDEEAERQEEFHNRPDAERGSDEEPPKDLFQDNNEETENRTEQ